MLMQRKSAISAKQQPIFFIASSLIFLGIQIFLHLYSVLSNHFGTNVPFYFYYCLHSHQSSGQGFLLFFPQPDAVFFDGNQPFFVEVADSLLVCFFANAEKFGD